MSFGNQIKLIHYIQIISAGDKKEIIMKITTCSKEDDVHKFEFSQIEQELLLPLKEFLLIAYGTDTYRQVLKSLEQMIIELELQHKSYIRWN
jgi:hypothetical protein